MPGDTAQSPIPCQEKVTYKIGNKVCCAESCIDDA